MRVVSLVPSATETLLAWGIVPVACTRFCEQPSITAVGGTKDPDLEAIVALDPDVVVMDEEENRSDDHAALVARGVEVHTLAIRSLDDVDMQLAELAARVGGVWYGLDPIAPPPPRARRSAFVPIWRRPWMALGVPTYGSSLLAAIGVDKRLLDERLPEHQPRRGAWREPRRRARAQRAVSVRRASPDRARGRRAGRLRRRQGPVLVGSTDQRRSRSPPSDARRGGPAVDG